MRPLGNPVLPELLIIWSRFGAVSDLCSHSCGVGLPEAEGMVACLSGRYIKTQAWLRCANTYEGKKKRKII